MQRRYFCVYKLLIDNWEGKLFAVEVSQQKGLLLNLRLRFLCEFGLV